LPRVARGVPEKVAGEGNGKRLRLPWEARNGFREGRFHVKGQTQLTGKPPAIYVGEKGEKGKRAAKKKKREERKTMEGECRRAPTR